MVVDSWKQGGHSSGWTAEDFAEAKAAWPKVLGLTKMMYDRGVRILAGSDTPNPFVIPGVSLHRELELLVDAGIPPAQVLKIATRTVLKRSTSWTRGERLRLARLQTWWS